MAIIDPAAIRFSNERIRPAADRLARCYYRGKALADSWSSLNGDNNAKFAVLKPTIESVATLITNTFRFCWWADRIWQSGSLVSLFPNDPLEIIWDNFDNTGPDLNRGEINSQDIRRLKNRMEEFTNWLSRGTDLDKHWVNDSSVILPIIYNYFDDVARMAEEGAKEPVTNWGRIVAVERCPDIVTEYETNSPNSLTHILRCAVNIGE